MTSILVLTPIFIRGITQMPEVVRFKEGLRVKCVARSTGVPLNTTGTVGKVATIGGKSIFCDPTRKMVFVNWDNGQKMGVFKWELERV
jgi:hypothetical protein